MSSYGQNKTVYYDSQGHMLYGSQTINGKVYYFNKVTGALESVTDATTDTADD
ncbi:hypothetical protein [Ligilactobacillus sp. WC1T17]|uniref:hypothetical protein n=1 Tax=Ligilactobacillus sp. WC1T17 TaxID=3158786 RepID=UPI00399D6B08